MAKVYLICGKICSGKSYYERTLKEAHQAVILSTDEATYDLIHNEQGDFYNVFASRVNRYLRKKAVEIVNAGANVILDWGFWTKDDRRDMSEFLNSNNVPYEWHYLDIEESLWMKNIKERNQRVLDGSSGSDFYVDEGLMKKLLSIFEIPDPTEIDVWKQIDTYR